MTKSMVKTNTVMYRVVGRYMNGSNVTGYHLIGSDGSQVKVTKEHIVYLIGKGVIENMRVQANGNKLILRGRGVNLNELPIYDEKKEEFRGNNRGKVVSMGEMELTKRIMYKNKCLGYMVRDVSGKEWKLSREKVIDLALKKLIKNVTVQKYNDSTLGKVRLILRGVGCDLSKLPILIVDPTGKIIDPSKDKDMTMRAVRLKRGGILYDKTNNIKIPFEAGDYIVCSIDGMRVVKANDMDKNYKVETGYTMAACDNYLDKLNNYYIEIFGSEPKPIPSSVVLKWSIVSRK
jgi:hypothetical protein